MMKCPTCGGPLKPSKKIRIICFAITVRKNLKVHSIRRKMWLRKQSVCLRRKRLVEEIVQKKIAQENENVKKERSVREQKYSNIPPKEVRDKREREMKKAYDDMLSVEEEKVSKAPIIILAIAIIVVAAVIVYMLLK